ncbi:MAG: RNA polymerase sigma factor [Steroidobacteraceae bacterium]
MSAPLSERECVEAAAAGSAAAFAWLVARHQQGVRAFLRRLSGNWAEADDLAQEVFLDAWLQIKRYQAEHEFRVWLCGMAYRKFMASRRSFWRRVKREIFAASEVISDEQVHRHDQHALLDLSQALTAFPIEQRAVLVLCVAADWSHSEAAVALGLPLGTVKSHIQRARAQLLESMASYAPAKRVSS